MSLIYSGAVGVPSHLSSNPRPFARTWGSETYFVSNSGRREKASGSNWRIWWKCSLYICTLGVLFTVLSAGYMLYLIGFKWSAPLMKPPVNLIHNDIMLILLTQVMVLKWGRKFHTWIYLNNSIHHDEYGQVKPGAKIQTRLTIWSVELLSCQITEAPAGLR